MSQWQLSKQFSCTEDRPPPGAHLASRKKRILAPSVCRPVVHPASLCDNGEQRRCWSIVLAVPSCPRLQSTDLSPSVQRQVVDDGAGSRFTSKAALLPKAADSAMAVAPLRLQPQPLPPSPAPFLSPSPSSRSLRSRASRLLKTAHASAMMPPTVLSLHPALPSDFAPPTETQPQFPQRMDTSPIHPPATPLSPEHGEPRGRRRERDDGDEAGGNDDAEPPSSRKRRRSRKGVDKKFVCPHEECGKTYSRAEHLYRHQLNRERMLSASQPDQLPLTDAVRQSEADLSVRFPGMRAYVRPAGPLHSSQGKTLNQGLDVAAQRQFLARRSRRCDDDDCPGRLCQPR